MNQLMKGQMVLVCRQNMLDDMSAALCGLRSAITQARDAYPERNVSDVTAQLVRLTKELEVIIDKVQAS